MRVVDCVFAEDEKVICTQCRHEIPLTNHHKIEENEIFKNFMEGFRLNLVLLCFISIKKALVQEMIHKLKYKGQEEIGEPLSETGTAKSSRYLKQIEQIDYIIPVPLHKKRLRERGYNQVEGLAKLYLQNLKFLMTVNFCLENYTKTQTKERSFRQS